MPGVTIGDNVIIDDFTYISTPLKLHSNVHISSGCKIIGGKNAFVEKEWSSLFDWWLWSTGQLVNKKTNVTIFEKLFFCIFMF